MRRWTGLVLGLLLIVAALAVAALPAPSRVVEPPPRDPRLAPWVSLSPGDERLLLSGRDGSPLPVEVRRVVARWETLDGVPHARVEWWTGGRLRAVEWLRVEATESGSRVVCSQRRIHKRVHRLDPPQPVLEVPLRAGARWSWSGTVRGAAARLQAEVRAASDPRHGPVLEVVQRVELIDAAAPPTERIRVYAQGQGLVAERWTLAAGQEAPRSAELSSPSEQPSE